MRFFESRTYRTKYHIVSNFLCDGKDFILYASLDFISFSFGFEDLRNLQIASRERSIATVCCRDFFINFHLPISLYIAEVPPLEDCSAELEKLGISEKPAEKAAPKRELLEYKEDAVASCFKKGFLLSGGSKAAAKEDTSSKGKQSEKRTESSELAEVKANADAKRQELVIDEVQSALKQSLDSQQSRWLNDDLLQKVETNTFLTSMMSRPGISEVLAEFQRDPGAAVRKYENNADISRFFAEFTTLLGSHFERMGVSDAPVQAAAAPGPAPELSEVRTVRKSKTSDEDTNVERKVRDALSEPQVREALSDRQVQKVIEALRLSPERGNSLWRQADDDTRRKLQILIQHGVLGVQR